MGVRNESESVFGMRRNTHTAIEGGVRPGTRDLVLVLEEE